MFRQGKDGLTQAAEFALRKLKADLEEKKREIDRVNSNLEKAGQQLKSSVSESTAKLIQMLIATEMQHLLFIQIQCNELASLIELLRVNINAPRERSRAITDFTQHVELEKTMQQAMLDSKRIDIGFFKGALCSTSNHVPRGMVLVSVRVTEEKVMPTILPYTAYNYAVIEMLVDFAAATDRNIECVFNTTDLSDGFIIPFSSPQLN